MSLSGPVTSYAFRSPVLTVVVTVVLLSLSACNVIGGDDYPLEGTNVSMAEIAGNWTASRATFALESTGQGVVTDLVAGGTSVNLAIQEDGRFILTFADAAGDTEVNSGQLGFDAEWLVVAFDESPEEPEYFVINFSGGVLNISGSGEYDVNEDSFVDPGTFEFFFDRS